jgi:hypothetical protein
MGKRREEQGDGRGGRRKEKGEVRGGRNRVRKRRQEQCEERVGRNNATEEKRGKCWKGGREVQGDRRGSMREEEGKGDGR